MEETEKWKQILSAARVKPEFIDTYVDIISANGIDTDDLTSFSNDDFQSFGFVDKLSNTRMRNYCVKENYMARKKLKLEEAKVSDNVLQNFIALLDKKSFCDRSNLIETIIKYSFTRYLNKPDDSPDIIEDPLLIVGPPRFGKTANLAMLEGFFEGTVSKEVFSRLLIGKNELAMKWHGRFSVIYLTFGLSSANISSKKDCEEACAHVLHKLFSSYEYLLNDMKECWVTAFKKWIDKDEYKSKTSQDISDGVSFLVDCVSYHHKKPIILLVDDFDRLCRSSLFNDVSKGIEMNKIVNVYSDMLGFVSKHQKKCHAIFTGVAAFTCQTLSPALNNLRMITFLKDADFAPYYGLTKEEFQFE